MAERYDHIEMRAGLTNTSKRWLLVGNYHVVIGSYATRDGAVQAGSGIGSGGSDGLAGTPYCRLDILAPGESIDGRLLSPVQYDDGVEITLDDLCAKPPV